MLNKLKTNNNMKTNVIISEEQIYNLYWKNIIQLRTRNEREIYDYINNSVFCFSCKFDQFKITSNYCNNIDVIEFMKIVKITS